MFQKRSTGRDELSQINDLESRCSRLQERLDASDASLKQRSELLYSLQQQYATEHFNLQESMRNLKIERMRNAGLFADRDIILQRAKGLQERILDLKRRLRQYEDVEDVLFDESPIVAESQ